MTSSSNNQSLLLVGLYWFVFFVLLRGFVFGCAVGSCFRLCVFDCLIRLVDVLTLFLTLMVVWLFCLCSICFCLCWKILNPTVH
jgi:hypothetical protein